MALRAVPAVVRDGAACTSRGDLDFFSSDQAVIRTCKNLCSTCPVKRECLSHALAEKELFGVWGGADGRELRTALNLTRSGAPEREASRPRCPLCRSVRRVELRRAPRTKTDVATCDGCGLVWRRARTPRATRVSEEMRNTA